MMTKQVHARAREGANTQKTILQLPKKTVSVKKEIESTEGKAEQKNSVRRGEVCVSLSDARYFQKNFEKLMWASVVRMKSAPPLP